MPRSTSARGSAAAAEGSQATSAAPGLHLPAFDGLRAIAALLVVLVHVAFVTGVTPSSSVGDFTARAEIGVAVFFLISGFLLYRPFVATHLLGRSDPSVWRFYVRRLLRIVPLYWVALTVVLLTVPDSGSGAQLISLYLFAQVYAESTVLEGIAQAWSLDIEMTFYLLLPAYALLLGRRRRDPARQFTVELAGLGALYAAALVYRLVMLNIDNRPPTWHAWLPNYLDLFALGMLLAVLHSWHASTGRVPAWTQARGLAAGCWIAAAGVYVVLATAIGLGRSPLFTGSGTTEVLKQFLYGLFALLLLAPAVFGPPRSGPVRKLLASRVLTLIGLVSYGIYLWHQWLITQVIDLFDLPLFRIDFWPFLLGVLVGVVALSTATYLAIERPFIARGREWTRRERQAGLPEASPTSR